MGGWGGTTFMGPFFGLFLILILLFFFLGAGCWN